MQKPEVYVNLDDQEICLGHLDVQERKLLARIRRRARRKPEWNVFDNYWTHEVMKFYDARGVPRKVARDGVIFRVAQDLSGRIAVATGWARLGDYRDDLEELIRSKYPTRQAFCDATGLSPDMVSHFLKGRKDLSLKALTAALAKIGYALHIRPIPAELLPVAKATTRKRTG